MERSRQANRQTRTKTAWASGLTKNERELKEEEAELDSEASQIDTEHQLLDQKVNELNSGSPSQEEIDSYEADRRRFNGRVQALNARLEDTSQTWRVLMQSSTDTTRCAKGYLMKRFFGKERSGDPSPRLAAREKLGRSISHRSSTSLSKYGACRIASKNCSWLAGREDPSIAFSIDKIQHVLKEIGIETRDYTGQTYNEGLSLDVLTFDYPVGEKAHQQNRAGNRESGYFLRRNTLQDGSGDCRKGR